MERHQQPLHPAFRLGPTSVCVVSLPAWLRENLRNDGFDGDDLHGGDFSSSPKATFVEVVKKNISTARTKESRVRWFVTLLVIRIVTSIDIIINILIQQRFSYSKQLEGHRGVDSWYNTIPLSNLESIHTQILSIAPKLWLFIFSQSRSHPRATHYTKFCFLSLF